MGSLTSKEDVGNDFLHACLNGRFEDVQKMVESEGVDVIKAKDHVSRNNCETHHQAVFM